MSKEAIKESLLKEVAKYLAGAAFGVLGALAFAIWQEAGVPLLTAFEQAASKTVLLRALFLLLLLILFSWFLFLLLWRRADVPLTQRFGFDSFGGYYIDPRTGHAVCPLCLSQGIVVHMMDVNGPKKCNACETICRGNNTNFNVTGNK